MKTKKIVIIGTVLVVLGLIMVIFAVTRKDFSLEKEINYEFVETTIELKEFTHMNIEVDYDNVRICTSDRTDIFIKTRKMDNMDYVIEEKSNSIDIYQDYKNPINNFFTGYHFSKSYLKEEVIIELPKDCSLIYDIKLNAGIFTIENLKTDSIDFELNAGIFNLNNVEAKELKIELNAGTASFDTLKIKSLYVTLDAGSFTSKNIHAEKVDLTVNAGTASFKGVITKQGDFEINAGSLRIRFADKKENYRVNKDGEGSVIINIEKALGSYSVTYDDK